MHSITPERLEIFKSLEGWASETLIPYLKPVEKSWQPQDFLPDPGMAYNQTETQIPTLPSGKPALADTRDQEEYNRQDGFIHCV